MHEPLAGDLWMLRPLSNSSSPSSSSPLSPQNLPSPNTAQPTPLLHPAITPVSMPLPESRIQTLKRLLNSIASPPTRFATVVVPLEYNAVFSLFNSAYADLTRASKDYAELSLAAYVSTCIALKPPPSLLCCGSSSA